jgi:hypothetical protein
MKSEKIIEVYWSRLVPTESSRYKRECPFCEGGMFLVGRNQDTMQLQEYDGCIGCGQRVRYLDIEKMRAMEA